MHHKLNLKDDQTHDDRTHDLKIMESTFNVREMLTLTTEPSGIPAVSVEGSPQSRFISTFLCIGCRHQVTVGEGGGCPDSYSHWHSLASLSDEQAHLHMWVNEPWDVG